MRSALLLILVFFAIWLILSTQTSIFYLFAGLISSLLVYTICQKLNKNHHNKITVSYGSLVYLVWLLKEIIISALKVTKIIWSPRMNINPGMKYIETIVKSRAKKVLYASSISLTPGTITIDLKNDSLLIHALNQSDLNFFEEGEMEQRIKNI